MAKNTNGARAEMVKAPPTSLAPADMVGHAGAGTEGLGAEDIRPPRLVLSQSMSPQLKRGNPRYIEGLRDGILFNDLTEEIYGEGPLEMLVVSFLGTRAIEFGEDNMVVDGDVRPGDPRREFTTNQQTGKRERPVATLFYDYLIWLMAHEEMLSLSMKGSQITVARTLNSLLKYPLKVNGAIVANPPAWARVFSLGTAAQKKDIYDFFNFTVKQKGVASVELRELASQLHDSYSGKNIIIEREPVEDDTFNTSNI